MADDEYSSDAARRWAAVRRCHRAARVPPTAGTAVVAALGKSDPLIGGDALQTVLDRGGFVPQHPDDEPKAAPMFGAADPIDTDPAIVTELIAQSEASLAVLKRDIATKTGTELIDFIRADIGGAAASAVRPARLPGARGRNERRRLAERSALRLVG